MTNYAKSLELKRELRDSATTIKNAGLAGHLDFVAKLATRHARIKLQLATIECELTMESLQEGVAKLSEVRIDVPKNALQVAVELAKSDYTVEQVEADCRKSAKACKAWTEKSNVKKIIREW